MAAFANRDDYERWKAQQDGQALMACPACDKAASTTAMTCQHCGHPFEAYERWRVQAGMASPGTREREVIVTDVKMPFLSMVEFMVKWSLAAIPALLILAIVWFLSLGILGGVFAALSKQ